MTKNSDPAWQVKVEGEWTVIAVTGRIDAFNFESFKSQLVGLTKGQGKCVALDLAEVCFLSLPTIKLLASLATDLRLNGGKLALLKASEKLKRQFDVYASLEPIRVVRHPQELSQV